MFGPRAAPGKSGAGAAQENSPWTKKLLVIPRVLNIYPLAQIARACGRVSVGGDPDKRPVNRRAKTGSRSEPANPAKRGTRLKATTDRAFSSLPAFQFWRTEEASLSCRACGRELIPSKRRPRKPAGSRHAGRRVQRRRTRPDFANGQPLSRSRSRLTVSPKRTRFHRAPRRILVIHEASCWRGDAPFEGMPR